METPALDWQKSSFCQTSECVEISGHSDIVLMRNSTQPGSDLLSFSLEDFRSFLEAAKVGKFDLVSGLPPELVLMRRHSPE